MSEEIISQCVKKARKAFRWSWILTSVITVAFLAYALDWISLYVVYPRSHVVVWQDYPRWMFPLKSAIVLFLLFALIFRLGMYATFRRFIDTKAARKPDSYFMVVKRHMDASASQRRAAKALAKEEFERKVREELDTPT